MPLLLSMVVLVVVAAAAAVVATWALYVPVHLLLNKKSLETNGDCQRYCY